MNTSDTFKFPHSTPFQLHNHLLQNTAVLPATTDGHQWQNRPRPVAGLEDPEHVKWAYHGVGDDHPLPPCEPPVLYALPNRVAQGGIPPKERLDTPHNQGRDHFDYAPQCVPSFPVQATFPDPFSHLVPTPGQEASEKLRQIAINYLQHPGYRVDLVTMKVGAAGNCQVVIILKLADIL